MPYADPLRQREYQRMWMAERRRAFFAEKRCEFCRSTDRLELHHRDPNQKVHHRIWSWSDDRRLAEIAKCVVLCRLCHQGAHSQARRIEAELRNPHGTLPRYRLGCRCFGCLEAKAKDSAEYRQRLASEAV